MACCHIRGTLDGLNEFMRLLYVICHVLMFLCPLFIVDTRKLS